MLSAVALEMPIILCVKAARNPAVKPSGFSKSGFEGIDRQVIKVFGDPIGTEDLFAKWNRARHR